MSSSDRRRDRRLQEKEKRHARARAGSSGIDFTKKLSEFGAFDEILAACRRAAMATARVGIDYGPEHGAKYLPVDAYDVSFSSSEGFRHHGNGKVTVLLSAHGDVTVALTSITGAICSVELTMKAAVDVAGTLLRAVADVALVEFKNHLVQKREAHVREVLVAATDAVHAWEALRAGTLGAAKGGSDE